MNLINLVNRIYRRGSRRQPNQARPGRPGLPLRPWIHRQGTHVYSRGVKPALSLLLAGLCLALTPTTQAEPEPSHWQAVKLDISYAGITTHYSCAGIESKLETILKTLGVAPKPSVTGFCDSGFGYPSRLSGAWLRYAVLVPGAPTGSAAAIGSVSPSQAAVTDRNREGHPNPSAPQGAPAMVMGEWQEVVLERNPRLGLDDGDCELLESLSHDLLPQLSVKVIEARFTCIPHELSSHSYRLRLSVFKPSVSAPVTPSSPQ